MELGNLDDTEFLDAIYAKWSQTTGAKNLFWTPEADKDFPGRWLIVAEGQDDPQQIIGEFWGKPDAVFICGMHDCLSEIVRRMGSALDEADRADRERDEQEQSIYALAVENDEMRHQIADLVQEVCQLRRERESWVSRAGDVLWKIERPM